MAGIPYPPKNCRIAFREPFPRREVYEGRKWYYIRAIIDEEPEKEIRMDTVHQTQFLDNLIYQDKKLLNAVVLCKDGRFELVQHSPQLDFFEAVK